MLKITEKYGIDFDARNVMVMAKPDKTKDDRKTDGWRPVAYYPKCGSDGFSAALRSIARRHVLVSPDLLEIARRFDEMNEAINQLSEKFAEQIAKEAMYANGDSEISGENSLTHTNPLPN